MGGHRGRLRLGWITLVCALTVSGALARTASAYIYVGDATHIVRANNDGTGVNSSFITVDGFVCGVAVDSTHIYWTGLNSVGRANLDGTGVQQDFFTIADPSRSFCGVAVDGSHVYWAERHNNNIGRADLDGGNPQPTLFTAASSPCGVAVDSTYAYFAPNASGPITRFPKNGGAPVAMGWASGNAACAIAVSDKAVYYADHNASGATPIHAASTTSPNVLADTAGATAPCGIAVNASALYWANDPMSGGSVGTVALGSDGGPVGTPNQSLITGLGSACGIAVDSLPLPAQPPGDTTPPPGTTTPPPGGTTPLAGDNPTPSAGGVTPSNAFKLGKFKALGGGLLPATVPGPGLLTAAAVVKKKAPIKKTTVTATKAGTFNLKIKPSSTGQRVLKKKGKLTVRIKVTFAPKGGKPASKTVRVTLKRRLHRK